MTTHSPSRKRASPSPARTPPRPPARAAAPGAALSTAARVVKKVTPPLKGSQLWLQRYGQALVCVRYREDPRRAMRYTTVELVVDSRTLPLQPHTLILVAIDPDDEDTRRRAIELGARWKRRDKAWLIPLQAAIQLDLTSLAPDRPDFTPAQPRR